MSEFSDYCEHIVCTASIGLWMHTLGRQFVRVLYEENILIDKIWFSVVHGAEYVEMRAMVYEDENDNLEATARWERDKAKVSLPLDMPWELVDVKVEPIAGLV